MRQQTDVRCNTLPPLTEAQLERFWRQVDTAGDCWLWRGPTADGRPQAHLQRRPRIRIRAATVAWWLSGRTLSKQFLLPSCGQVLCIRPEHHDEVTVGDLAHNSDEARAVEFWSRLLSPNVRGCREWPKPNTRNGAPSYGTTSWHGEHLGTHRLAYRLTFGDIPAGLFVCHTCDNPPCCNPSHLFLGTSADNQRDMAEKGRAARVSGLQHHAAVLTADQVALVRHLWHVEQWTAKDVGLAVGCAQMVAWKAAVGATYAALPMPEERRPRAPHRARRGRRPQTIPESFGDSLAS